MVEMVRLFSGALKGTRNRKAALTVCAHPQTGLVHLHFTCLTPPGEEIISHEGKSLEDIFSMFEEERFAPWRKAAFAVRDDISISRNVSLLQNPAPSLSLN